MKKEKKNKIKKVSSVYDLMFNNNIIKTIFIEMNLIPISKIRFSHRLYNRYIIYFPYVVRTYIA